MPPHTEFTTQLRTKHTHTTWRQKSIFSTRKKLHKITCSHYFAMKHFAASVHIRTVKAPLTQSERPEFAPRGLFVCAPFIVLCAFCANTNSSCSLVEEGLPLFQLRRRIFEIPSFSLCVCVFRTKEAELREREVFIARSDQTSLRRAPSTQLEDSGKWDLEEILLEKTTHITTTTKGTRVTVTAADPTLGAAVA